MKKISLAGCVFIEDDRILLIKRISTGWYELPGGKIEEGETPEITAVREIKEELSTDVKLIYKLGEKDFDEGGRTMSYTWFQARFNSNQEPSIGEPDKFNEIKYIRFNELSQCKLSPNMENFLQEYNSGNIKLII